VLELAPVCQEDVTSDTADYFRDRFDLTREQSYIAWAVIGTSVTWIRHLMWWTKHGQLTCSFSYPWCYQCDEILVLSPIPQDRLTGLIWCRGVCHLL